MRVITFCRWAAAALNGIALSVAGVSVFSWQGALVFGALSLIYIVHAADAVQLVRRAYWRGVVAGIHVAQVDKSFKEDLPCA